MTEAITASGHVTVDDGYYRGYAPFIKACGLANRACVLWGSST